MTKRIKITLSLLTIAIAIPAFAFSYFHFRWKAYQEETLACLDRIPTKNTAVISLYIPETTIETIQLLESDLREFESRLKKWQVEGISEDEWRRVGMYAHTGGNDFTAFFESLGITRKHSRYTAYYELKAGAVHSGTQKFTSKETESVKSELYSIKSQLDENWGEVADIRIKTNEENKTNS